MPPVASKSTILGSTRPLALPSVPGMATTKTLRAGHYFLATQGLAMIRDFLDDPEVLTPRADEIAQIVANMEEFPHSLEVPVTRYDVEDGYTRWAPRYDGPNPAIEAESPVLARLFDGLGDRTGVALDAACGTGRHAANLAARGWEVIGVDRTPAMLDVARSNFGADFRRGELSALPIDDASVDLVVCSLALTHVEDLTPVFAEFARVLRPGGTLITSDMHPSVTARGGMAAFPVDEPDGPPVTVHYVPNLTHQAGEYVTAMLRAGLQITDCIEPTITDRAIEGFPSYAIYPEATRRAYEGFPYLLIWQATKPS